MGSWLDLVKTNYIIATGDGKSFTPFWIKATKEKEYNIAEFEFPNIAGTLVKRGQPLGRKFAIEIFFTGDTHIDDATAFEASADDPRPWTITHPFYGIITVQPTQLTFDNNDYNVSKITGLVIETIPSNNPVTTVDPINAITVAKNNLDTTFENALKTPPTSNDVSSLSASNLTNFKIAVPNIKLPNEFNDYSNAFNQAQGAVNNAIAYPSQAITLTLNFISKPAQFTTSVKVRLDMLNNQLTTLRNTVANLVNPSSKEIYQNTAGTILSTMCLATTLPPVDSPAPSANQVLAQMDTINAAYSNYLVDLDTLQTTNAGNTSSFVADADSLIALNDLINLTVANLYQIALASKQQRTYFLPNDTNFILLTQQFYGLDAYDNNIEELINENNLGLNGLLQIPKGAAINYYI